MSIPNLFAALVNATGAELDANFQYVGLLGALPCAVVGTNALTLTPGGDSITPTAYQQGLVVTGVATNANTGAVTMQVGSLGLEPVYYDTGSGPVALAGGEIQPGNEVVFVYDPTIPGWHLIHVPLTYQLNGIGAVQGDVLYRGVSGWVALGPGNAGQVLETGGAAANPSWKNFSVGSTAGVTSAISVTASPFTYTAGNQYETIYITGGTVSVVSVAGTTVFSASPCTVRLAPGKAVVVTYSVLPTMNKTLD